MSSDSPWRNTPRKILVVAPLAVFFTFATLGLVGDMMDAGRQPPFRFALSVVLSGLFAAAYAVFGVALKSKWWKAAIPLFVLQFVAMGSLGHFFPDAPELHQMNVAETARMHSRLMLDGLSCILTVSLGYAGFAFVMVSESRRHIRVRAEMSAMEAEMAAAREIQQLILPDQAETFSGYTVESVYQPAQQVGGDFFQILPSAGNGLLVIVGDVAGKGLPAAMLVSMLVGSIRATAEETHDPVRMLNRIHDRLIGRTRGGFATAIAAHITGDGQVTLANAGHLSPYLDGTEVELSGALPLGIEGGGRYEARRLQLNPGSRLTFYSDGVVEAQNQAGELFGFDRARAISREPAAAIAAAAVKFGQSDDITVVTIQRKPAPASLNREAASILARA